MKYLHKFETVEEFNTVYENTVSEIVTAFTCSEGTFTYSGSVDIEGYTSYVWTNGDKTLGTDTRNPEVGTEVYYNGSYIEIMAVSTTPADPSTFYHEPWVSAVKYEQPTVGNEKTVLGIHIMIMSKTYLRAR